MNTKESDCVCSFAVEYIVRAFMAAHSFDVGIENGKCILQNSNGEIYSGKISCCSFVGRFGKRNEKFNFLAWRLKSIVLRDGLFEETILLHLTHLLSYRRNICGFRYCFCSFGVQMIDASNRFINSGTVCGASSHDVLAIDLTRATKSRSHIVLLENT